MKAKLTLFLGKYYNNNLTFLAHNTALLQLYSSYSKVGAPTMVYSLVIITKEKHGLQITFNILMLTKSPSSLGSH